MTRLLILLYLLLMTYSIQVKINECTCQQVLKKDECEHYYQSSISECKWNEQKQVCENNPVKDQFCSKITNGDECDIPRSCGWINGKCKKFKQCSDYKETVDQKCNNIKSTCILVKDDQCGEKKITLTCESIDPRFCFSTSDKFCVLSGNPPKCVEMTSCEQGSYNPAQCQKNEYSCSWDYDKCRNKKCSDKIKKEHCKHIYSFDRKMATLCHWTAEGKCIDAKESDQTEENCFYVSLYGRVWKDDKCQSCSTSLNPDP